VAQFDKSVTVLKLRAARERLRRKGHRVEGRKPYGFRPDEKRILDQMREMRQRPRGERLSYDAIAAQLNSQGHTHAVRQALDARRRLSGAEPIVPAKQQAH
jgi:O6-methylguanine-DNA--protein-cysteine methyltransferase